MEKFKSKSGYDVYKCTSIEYVKALDIDTEDLKNEEIIYPCGVCEIESSNLYIVPVLDNAICEKCYKEWEQKAEFRKSEFEFQTYFETEFEKMVANSGIEIKQVIKNVK